MIEIIREETLEEREERRKREGQAEGLKEKKKGRSRKESHKEEYTEENTSDVAEAEQSQDMQTPVYGIPKNVRQIGENSGLEKIYIEDYVMTHMKQLAAYGDEKPKVLILYGKREIIDGQLFWFISGSVQAEAIDSFMDKITFDENVWTQINETANRFFRGLSILGWAFLKKNGDDYWDEMIVNTHRKIFRPDQKIFFEYIMNERMENMYLFEKGRMNRQSGFFVYYERNEPMQNYMLSYKEAETGQTEEYTGDQATKQFRTIVQEKKEQMRRRHTMGLLYGTSAILVMVIMVIGITMLNNYEKMQNMEQVLYKISGQMEEVQTVETNSEITDETVVSTVDYTNSTDDFEKASAEAAPAAVLENTSADSGQSSPADDVDVKESVSDNASDEAVNDEGTANGEEGGTKAEEVREENPDQDTADGQAVETVSTIPKEYIIQKGDTLAKISRKFYGTENMIQKICDLNHIQDMDNILYGEKILLP